MSKWTFSYFAVWFGGSFWWVSSRFIDSEIVPKWFFAMFGTTVFCVVCAVAAFLLPEIRRTGVRFTAVSAAVLLCAASQAAYALLQWSGVCDSCGVFPACGSFDNPAGLASALAFSVPFGCHLAEHRQKAVRLSAWTVVVLVTAAVVASESRSGMLAVCAVGSALPPRVGTVFPALAAQSVNHILEARTFRRRRHEGRHTGHHPRDARRSGNGTRRARHASLREHRCINFAERLLIEGGKLRLDILEQLTHGDSLVSRCVARPASSDTGMPCPQAER